MWIAYVMGNDSKLLNEVLMSHEIERIPLYPQQESLLTLKYQLT